MKLKNFLLGAVILVTLIGLAYSFYSKAFRQSITIAFVGPLSGEGAAAGRLMKQAIELYLDKINQTGGVNGKKIALKLFDDQNDKDKAQQEALKIVKENKAVAVIGHWYSSASISGGKIYKQYRIPAITPGSTNIQVTQDNEWYFRNIYNAKASGQFLANYIQKVIHSNKVSIIHEEAAYGSYLAKVFEAESRLLGMEVVRQWHYNSRDNNLNDLFKKIVFELKALGEDAGVILLAVKASEGVKLVRFMRDENIQNKMIGSSSLSEETFRNGFDSLHYEKDNPGYYINDIYVATPFIFDTANEKAQKFKEEYQTRYDEEPDWSAAYAYDTAMILVEAIKQANIQGTQNSLPEDREKVRDTLTHFNNIYDALEGVTGFNYFDQNRDAPKTVSLGVYKQKNSVSALTQLQLIRNPNQAHIQAQEKERILFINNKYMYKTSVVYVGIKFFSVTEFEQIEDDLQATLDFKLWFRFQGQFKPENIEFLNAVDPKALEEQLQQPLEEKNKDQITYRVYRIKGRFRVDFLPHYHAYKQHVVGVSLRHQTLSRNHLIYVTDILGMGQNKEKSSDFVKRLSKARVINPASGWKINRVWFFPSIIKEFSLGDPDLIDSPGGVVEYSQFNAAIQIGRDEFTVLNVISYLLGIVSYKDYAINLMIISVLTLIALALIGARTRFSKLIWFFQVIFAFLWLLSLEIIVADWLAEKQFNMKMIIRIFEILWWVIPAILIHIASERFVWSPLEKQVGTIPNIIRHFFALLIYFFAGIGITVFVYDYKFNTLLATSGMVAMIVGLAIQINISNVFSGIVINMERPFRIGDWVKIADFDEGKIIDINWRATRIKRRDGCMVSIPNSQASESAIINFHYPNKTFWLWPTVYVHPRHSPEQVKKILRDALLSAHQVLREPEPIVFFMGINEWAAAYWIAFCSDNYGNKHYILEDVWTRVWFHLSRANISPAVMRQEIHIFKGDKGGDFKVAELTALTEEDFILKSENYQEKTYLDGQQAASISLKTKNFIPQNNNRSL